MCVKLCVKVTSFRKLKTSGDGRGGGRRGPAAVNKDTDLGSCNQEYSSGCKWQTLAGQVRWCFVPSFSALLALFLGCKRLNCRLSAFGFLFSRYFFIHKQVLLCGAAVQVREEGWRAVLDSVYLVSSLKPYLQRLPRQVVRATALLLLLLCLTIVARLRGRTSLFRRQQILEAHLTPTLLNTVDTRVLGKRQGIPLKCHKLLTLFNAKAQTSALEVQFLMLN